MSTQNLSIYRRRHFTNIIAVTLSCLAAAIGGG